jgi:hypothetical protein
LIISIIAFIIGLIDSLFAGAAQLDDHGASALGKRGSIACTIIFAIAVMILFGTLLYSVLRPRTSPFQSTVATLIPAFFSFLFRVFRRLSRRIASATEDEVVGDISSSSIHAYHAILSETYDDEMVDDASSALQGILSSNVATRTFNTHMKYKEKINDLLRHLLSPRASRRSFHTASAVMETLIGNMLVESDAGRPLKDVLSADVLLAVMDKRLSGIPVQFWSSPLMQTLVSNLKVNAMEMINLDSKKITASSSSLWYFRILWSKWDTNQSTLLDLRRPMGIFVRLFATAMQKSEPPFAFGETEFREVLGWVHQDIMHHRDKISSINLQVALIACWEGCAYAFTLPDSHPYKMKIIATHVSILMRIIRCSDRCRPFQLLPQLHDLWKNGDSERDYCFTLISVLLRDFSHQELAAADHSYDSPNGAETVLAELALLILTDTTLSFSKYLCIMMILSWLAVLPRTVLDRVVNHIHKRRERDSNLRVVLDIDADGTISVGHDINSGTDSWRHRRVGIGGSRPRVPISRSHGVGIDRFQRKGSVSNMDCMFLLRFTTPI